MGKSLHIILVASNDNQRTLNVHQYETLSRRNTRLSNGLDERKRDFRTSKTQTQRLAQQQRLARILNICLLKIEPFNPYKPSDLFVERRQIVQIQTRRHSAAS